MTHSRVGSQSRCRPNTALSLERENELKADARAAFGFMEDFPLKADVDSCKISQLP
jgi:hypothetical protein